MSAPDEEIPLAGGNVGGGAIRVGATVRRRTGPWTPAVHELLEFLATTPLAAVPRVHGVDPAGREILDFLEGEVIDVDTEVLDDNRLVAVGRWLRRFHDAVAAHRPGSRRWYFGHLDLRPDEVICHNDVAPYNMAFDGEALVGVFDWEMAGPGQPVDDLAFFVWNGLPLFRPTPDRGPADDARRLLLLTGAYGDPAVDAPMLLDRAMARMRLATDRIETGQRAGDEGMLSLGRAGEPARTRAHIDAAARRLPAIHAALASMSSP